MKRVPLHGPKARGRVALVDDADYELAMSYRWQIYERARQNGNINGPYARTSLPRRNGHRSTLYLHTLLTGYTQTDHRDGNGLNCQRYNMREATDAQNAQNRGVRSDSTSGYKGICLDRPSGRWRASIGTPRRHLGMFATPEEAAKAYDRAAREAWPDHCRLNFPD
jgi:hypothetical protein